MPLVDLSPQYFTGPLADTVPGPLLVGPKIAASAASSHSARLEMLRGLNPVALGLNNLGLIGLIE
jgi:hypothetical protein